MAAQEKAVVPDRPLLNLPAPTPLLSPRRYGGGASVSRPSRDRQRERIDPKFARLSAAAETPADLLALRADPASIAPERAIVFEVEGSLEDFYEQARIIGLEYLGDFEDEFDPSEDFFNTKKPEQQVSGRIYLAMPDVQALRELLSLWERYKQNKNMPKGRSGWRDLFSRLVDVRAWGPQDRIAPGAVEAWESDLARAPDEPVRLEIELWFHASAEQRILAFERLNAEIAAAGGQVIQRSTIPEIHYDAALIDLPGVFVRGLIDNPAVSLARADDIMFLRPQSVAHRAGMNLRVRIATPLLLRQIKISRLRLCWTVFQSKTISDSPVVWLSTIRKDWKILILLHAANTGPKWPRLSFTAT
jgi:hypothetical protein